MLCEAERNRSDKALAVLRGNWAVGLGELGNNKITAVQAVCGVRGICRGAGYFALAYARRRQAAGGNSRRQEVH